MAEGEKGRKNGEGVRERMECEGGKKSRERERIISFDLLLTGMCLALCFISSFESKKKVKTRLKGK